MAITLNTAVCATRGARSYQEDHALIGGGPGARAAEKLPLIAVLADGMGGHTSGALASEVACERFLLSAEASVEPSRARLRRALFEANEALAERVAKSPRLAGMGSTLVGLTIGPEGLWWVSVGDSPLYLVRHGEIAVLNEDHSMAPALDEMAARGEISEARAKMDPRRHMLRSAVTGEEIDLVDLSQNPLALYPGDHVLMASDGIHTLEPDEIARMVGAYADLGPAAIAAAIIRAIDLTDEEQQDNATVIVIAVTDGADVAAEAVPRTGDTEVPDTAGA